MSKCNAPSNAIYGARIQKICHLMYFKLQNFLKISKVITVATSLIFFNSGVVVAGSAFSERGNVLVKALQDYLIAQGVCKEYRACDGALHMYREDSEDHIYLKIYEQKHKELSSIVIKFLILNGINLTSGVPITLMVFDGPKTQYLGFGSIVGRNQESIKLEITK